jgi:hypothetical protein
MQDYAAAETNLLSAYKLLQSWENDMAADQIQRVSESLGTLYEALYDDAQAAEWRQRLNDFKAKRPLDSD